MNILLAILATYSIATLLSEYDGPFEIFFKARRSRLSPLLTCGVCVGTWVAIPISIALNLSPMEYLAVTGGVILLSRNA